MASNIAQFRLEVERSFRDVRTDAQKFHRRVHFEALSRIVRRTPVDTGRARGNWQSSIGGPARGKRFVDDPIRAGQMAVSGIAPFSVSFITNNLPYIRVLEDGGFRPPDPGPSKDRRKGRRGQVLVRGGYSVQAPQGMVNITVQELRRWVQGQ